MGIKKTYLKKLLAKLIATMMILQALSVPTFATDSVDIDNSGAPEKTSIDFENGLCEGVSIIADEGAASGKLFVHEYNNSDALVFDVYDNMSVSKLNIDLIDFFAAEELYQIDSVSMDLTIVSKIGVVGWRGGAISADSSSKSIPYFMSNFVIEEYDSNISQTQTISLDFSDNVVALDETCTDVAIKLMLWPSEIPYYIVVDNITFYNSESEALSLDINPIDSTVVETLNPDYSSRFNYEYDSASFGELVYTTIMSYDSIVFDGKYAVSPGDDGYLTYYIDTSSIGVVSPANLSGYPLTVTFEGQDVDGNAISKSYDLTKREWDDFNAIAEINCNLDGDWDFKDDLIEINIPVTTDGTGTGIDLSDFATVDDLVKITSVEFEKLSINVDGIYGANENSVIEFYSSEVYLLSDDEQSVSDETFSQGNIASFESSVSSYYEALEESQFNFAEKLDETDKNNIRNNGSASILVLTNAFPVERTIEYTLNGVSSSCVIPADASSINFVLLNDDIYTPADSENEESFYINLEITNGFQINKATLKLTQNIPYEYDAQTGFPVYAMVGADRNLNDWQNCYWGPDCENVGEVTASNAIIKDGETVTVSATLSEDTAADAQVYITNPIALVDYSRYPYAELIVESCKLDGQEVVVDYSVKDVKSWHEATGIYPEELVIRGAGYNKWGDQFFVVPDGTKSFEYTVTLKLNEVDISDLLGTAGDDSSLLAINEENFPDEIFRGYISENFDIDEDAYLSDEEISDITNINVLGMSIASLTGIEHFEELLYLECSENNLTSLDISHNTKLLNLRCSYNDIGNVDVSNNPELQWLIAYDIGMTSLDVSNNPDLLGIFCPGNQLTSLDLSNNPDIYQLYCAQNMLTTLDVSCLPKLSFFGCENNKLTYLNVEGCNLSDGFNCSNNQLTSLDLSSNTSLASFECVNNMLVIEDDITEIDLSDLTGFDPENASDWNGCTYDAQTNTISDFTLPVITYSYDCGNGNTATFSIKILSVIESMYDGDWSVDSITVPLDVLKQYRGNGLKVTLSMTYMEGYDYYLLAPMLLNPDWETLYAESEREDYLTDILYKKDIPENELWSTGCCMQDSGHFLISKSVMPDEITFTLTTEGLQHLIDNESDLGFQVYGSVMLDYELDGTVNPTVNVTGVSLDKTTLELGIDNSATLTATVSPSNATDKSVTWYSSDESIVTVDENGKVTAVAEGTATITVKTVDGEFTDTCTVEVIVPVTGVSLDKTTLELGIDNSATLTATITPADATDKSVTWTSSNKSVATVDANGKVTAVAEGIATITVKTVDGEFTDTCSVEVYDSALAIDSINFPDEIFRDYISKSFDLNSNSYLSAVEIAAVTDIDVSQMGISDLKGIEFFTSLKNLWCFANRITAIDVSKNTKLTQLYIDVNDLTTLDVSKNTELVVLDCSNNSLTTLDLSKNTKLEKLYCSGNELTALNVTANTALTVLSCNANAIKSLDISKNTMLTTLYCAANVIESLDVSQNTQLALLHCPYNNITSIDVSNNTKLEEFNCSGNYILSVDLSKNTALKKFECDGNKRVITDDNVTEIDLSQYPEIDLSKASEWSGCTFDAQNNKLTGLVSDEISFIYDCNNGYSAKFMFLVEGFVFTIDNGDYSIEVNEKETPIKNSMQLVVEEIIKTPVVEKVEELIEEVADAAEEVTVFDINIVDSLKNVVSIVDTEIEIAIPVSKGENTAYYFNGEELVKVASRVANGFIYIKTNHLSMYVIAKEETTRLAGDVNGDGRVNIRDVVLLYQYVSRWNVTIDLEVANVNADSAINIRDVVLLYQYISRWQVVIW